MQKQHRTLYIGLALFVQMIIVRILARFPEFIERTYSNGLYPVLSKAFRYTFGWMPFSDNSVYT